MRRAVAVLWRVARWPGWLAVGAVVAGGGAVGAHVLDRPAPAFILLVAAMGLASAALLVGRPATSIVGPGLVPLAGSVAVGVYGYTDGGNLVGLERGDPGLARLATGLAGLAVLRLLAEAIPAAAARPSAWLGTIGLDRPAVDRLTAVLVGTLLVTCLARPVGWAGLLVLAVIVVRWPTGRPGAPRPSALLRRPAIGALTVFLAALLAIVLRPVWMPPTRSGPSLPVTTAWMVPLALALVATLDLRVEAAAIAAVGARRPWARAAGLVLLAALVGAAAWGVARQWPLNDSPTITDQGAYLDYADALATRSNQIVGDRNRMPVVPYLASLAVDPSATERGQLPAGKVVGIVIAAAASIALGWWLARRAGPLVALAAGGTIVLAIAMTKAPYIQADLLSYFALLAATVTASHLIRRPGLRTGIAAGIAVGLLQLTKANALPIVVTASATVLLATVLPRRISGVGAAWRRRAIPALGVAAVVAASFLAPYATNSHRQFGSYSYNANSTFYVWYDSWPEALAGTWSHGDTYQYPDLPADQIPSLRWYLRDHDAGDIVARTVDGARLQQRQLWSFTSFSTPLALLLVGAVAVAGTTADLRRRLRAHWPVLAFAATTVLAYAFVAAWWVPIAAGPRFALVPVLPMVCGAALVIARLGRRQMARIGPHLAVRLDHLLLGAVVVALVAMGPAFVMQAGAVAAGS